MASEKRECRLAVIGLGPRALGAMEALVARLPPDKRISVELFDPCPWPGAGPNFSPEQDPLCLLNIPRRAIDLGEPPLSAHKLGGFNDWCGPGIDPDTFPPRAEFGQYLVERWRHVLHGSTTVHHRESVTRLEREDGGWFAFRDDVRYGPYDEVLLTLGQPQTRADDQLVRWRRHAERCGLDLVHAYPARAMSAAAEGWAGQTVAIRGLGLSTLDVLRLLSLGLGGRFSDAHYHPSGREPARILPFSLDGHAPVPKPASAKLDDRFDPLPDETRLFGEAVSEALNEAPDDALTRICDAFIGPTLRILSETGSTTEEEAVRRWLRDECDQPGAQEKRDPRQALQAGIGEASGDLPPSPGYVIGQLMRKWQDRLRQSFNPSSSIPDTAAAIIGFDDGLKRYSYGPPLSSARELLLLIEAGIVDLQAAEDPDIKLVEDGWKLGGAGLTARAMVDAVLPSPDLTQVSDPLLCDLKADRRIRIACKGMGAATLPDGQLMSADGQRQPGLCLLGRLALGSVIAVDSVHDCFGASSVRWAEGLISRL